MFGQVGKLDHQAEALMMLGLALFNRGEVDATTEATQRGLRLRAKA